VLANATLAHGLDFDDTRQDAIVHTGCVAVTTALAVGEAVAATGGQLLEALIAGVEVMCRVGLAVPGALHARHFHPTAIAGSFGAAAAAARLQKLSEEQLVRAFGICGSQAGGIIEYLADGSWTKRLHPGWAALASRRLVLGHQVVAFLALAPVVIPGVVLAVGLFVAYTRPPLILYGTLWILFVAYLTKEMPVGYAQSEATFRGIPADLEDAGRILGAGRLRVLLDVTAPLAKSGVIAAWCFIFIGVIRELSASILLFTPDTKVMSVVMFDLKEEGQFGAIAVLGLTMLALTFATVALVQAVLGRDVLGARD
jgi:ABC-type molybdate transport system permease subunit